MHVHGMSAVLWAFGDAGSDGKYNNTGAQADLWCGPSNTSKIAIDHFFSGLQSNGVRSEVSGIGAIKSRISNADDGTQRFICMVLANPNLAYLHFSKSFEHIIILS